MQKNKNAEIKEVIERMLEELEKKIGYAFQDKELLKLAMTHKSFSNERMIKRQENNERLEFLGDAVLELVSSQFLFLEYPEKPEGFLTELRASIVCEPTLALCAKELSLGSFLRLGKGESYTGGRKRPSITSDALEALIGALYLDGGFEAAENFVKQFILKDIEKKQLFHDSKTKLQEVVQRDYPEAELSYRIVKETGPDHDKTFQVEVYVGEQMFGSGVGHSKKNAEQEAAYQALLKLQPEE